jgi:cell wall-associated NlpC family hydrolase
MTLLALHAHLGNDSVGDPDGLPDVPAADPSVVPADQGDGDHPGEPSLAAGTTTPAVSGLSDHHRAQCRGWVLHAAELMLRHPASVHYTQGGDRWSAIRDELLPWKGEYLRRGDCSSTATWMLWLGLGHHFGLPDHVNGQLWRAGYTGTLVNHGKGVAHDENLKVGDLVFYGDQGAGVPEHVAVYTGGGYVFSHGSDAGPFKLALDYRGDRGPWRRYI